MVIVAGLPPLKWVPGPDAAPIDRQNDAPRISAEIPVKDHGQVGTNVLDAEKERPAVQPRETGHRVHPLPDHDGAAWLVEQSAYLRQVRNRFGNERLPA